MNKLERILFVSVLLFLFYCGLSDSMALNDQTKLKDADLTQIYIDCGSLSPEFNTEETNYTLYLDKRENITIIAFAVSQNAVIEINGVSCKSGYPCTISMDEYDDALYINVTAGSAQRHYTIRLVFNTQNLPALKGLTLSAGSLDPEFNPDVTCYSVTVPYIIDNLQVTPIANEVVDCISINNTLVENGSTVSVPLSIGNNVIAITLLAADCSTRTYVLNVVREEMPPPALSGLKLSVGTLSPSFSPNKTIYTAIVESKIKTVDITPTGNIGTKVITINNNIVQSGSGYTIDLDYGENIIWITAANGTGASTTYILIINRKMPESGTLQDLEISAGKLSPSFSSLQTSYSANVDSDISVIELTPFDEIESDKILINGLLVESGEKYRMPLFVGDNTAVITVISQSGIVNNYTLTINRKAADSPGLSSLLISDGTLNPAFSTRTQNYTARVDYSVNNLIITPTARDNTQIITINGERVQDGTNYTLPLSVGPNHIQITVSMEDGRSKTYNLDVTRSVEAPSGLKELTVVGAELSPAFSSDVTTYSAKVDNSVSNVYINAVPDSAQAKVKISGTTTGHVSLSPGINVITITVTSVDGSTKTYTLNIFRGYKIKVTVNSKSGGDRYIAQVPDYLELVDDSDNFEFVLGKDSVIISAKTLKSYKGTGNLLVVSRETQQDILNAASELTDDDCSAICGTDITTEGGTAVVGSQINAGAVISFSSKEKKYLEQGTPVVYYYDAAAGKLQNVGAVFDLDNKTVSFTAFKSGSYIFAVKLKSPSINYTVKADAKYTSTGTAKAFNVTVNRELLSYRLKNAKLMVVTTLSNGMQSYMFIPLEKDSSTVTVIIDKRAIHSEVYLISGSFDGRSIPTTYALTQYVST